MDSQEMRSNYLALPQKGPVEEPDLTAKVSRGQSASAGTRIRYMGNKRGLAREVAAACESLDRDRPVVDLFGGMCNVAGALANRRKVRVNDVQSYAELSARCLIASRKNPPSAEQATRVLRASFEANRQALRERFAQELEDERVALSSSSPACMEASASQWRHSGNDTEIAREVRRVRDEREGVPYRLCTLSYAWGYFGIEQCIDIDSLRFAIDQARDSVGLEDARWLRLALLQTASRIASTPGHFAQFLRPTGPKACARIISYRRRAVWTWFQEDVSSLRPFGTVAWRRRNRVTRSDALNFIDREAVVSDGPPAIYYADPPYSKEHYSRFYHLLETLERYDYPDAVGLGRYRPDRFRSPFAVASQVVEATEKLCAGVARIGGTLIFSYPSTGLLHRAGVDLGELLEGHFKEVRLYLDRPGRHSTLGGRNGSPTKSVREQIWIAA